MELPLHAELAMLHQTSKKSRRWELVVFHLDDIRYIMQIDSEDDMLEIIESIKEEEAYGDYKQGQAKYSN